MGGSLAAEILKLRKRPATWIIAILWLLLAVGFGYVLPYLIYLLVSNTPEAQGGGAAPAEVILAGALPESLIGTTLGLSSSFGGALALILGALLIGSEYGWNTLKTILTQRPARLEVYAGKLLALALLLVVLVLAAFLSAMAASAVVAAIRGVAAGWPPVWDIVRGIAAGWLILAMWSLFGVMLALLARSTALAIGLGLVWFLVVENLVGGFASLAEALATVNRALPGVNAGSLAGAFRAAGQTGAATGQPPSAVGATQAALVTLAYAAAFALLAGFVLRRRDVT